MISFQDLREQLSDETIKDILGEFNVEPVSENSDEIVFPTCCHNLSGGSPKLYYYKDSKLFHCYTECAATFDIFSLLQKMYRLRGQEISLTQAIGICGLNNMRPTNEIVTSDAYEIRKTLEFHDLQQKNILPDLSSLKINKYDKNVLRQFSFDADGLKPWTDEGITTEALLKFNISYDKKHNAAIIPNFDYDGNLIGIRQRFFNPQDMLRGKYRPMYWNGVLYNHPTGLTFYGIYENHKSIERSKMCVIFEGEKSVLKMRSLYGEQSSLGLATLGQNITRNHIQWLFKMNVHSVILAYDSDYEDYKQLKEVEEKYIQKAKILSPFFNVSILMDYDFVLPYKSSPIDGGKEIFEKILKEKRIVR